MAEMLHARIETEVLAQAREPKPGRDDVIRLLDTSDEEYRQKIRSQLGETHFVQFEAYFDSLLIRNGMVNFFAEAALRTSPFTPAQRDTLVAAVQAQSQGRTAEPFADGQFTPAQLALLDAWLPGYLSNNARSREIRAKYERDPARRAQASGRDIYERAGAFAGLP
jgi:hypothetical protein